MSVTDNPDIILIVSLIICMMCVKNNMYTYLLRPRTASYYLQLANVLKAGAPAERLAAGQGVVKHGR